MIIYPDEPIYVINGFSRRTDITLEAFNFLIGLKSNFALKAYDTKLPDGVFEKLNNGAKGMIKDLGEKSKYIKNPYSFVENNKGNLTTLLHWCCVPGNSCELGIEGSDTDSIRQGRFNSKMLGYGPHNIDNRTQAYSLLSIWLNWVDSAFAILSD